MAKIIYLNSRRINNDNKIEKDSFIADEVLKVNVSSVEELIEQIFNVKDNDTIITF